VCVGRGGGFLQSGLHFLLGKEMGNGKMYLQHTLAIIQSTWPIFREHIVIIYLQKLDANKNLKSYYVGFVLYQVICSKCVITEVIPHIQCTL
jgi:hypothetical protein